MADEDWKAHLEQVRRRTRGYPTTENRAWDRAWAKWFDMFRRSGQSANSAIHNAIKQTTDQLDRRPTDHPGDEA